MGMMNIHRQITAVRLRSTMNNTQIAKRLTSSPKTIGDWIMQYDDDKFGLTKTDVEFLAKEFGIIERDHNV